jgi:tryptophan synthase alpha chain
MKIICYLSNGYPSIEETYKIGLEYVDAGCDIIEIDFPSRDPYLESEYIAGRMKKALELCNDYRAYMDSIIKLKETLKDTKFIVMIYENVIEEIGIETFTDFCIKHDFKDIILVGIKDDVIKKILIEKGIKVSCYVQYHLLDEEIAQAKETNGFVYLQAKPTTGLIHEEHKELKDCIDYLRSNGIKQPIYCGVGVHSPEDVKMVKEAGGDAAFIGSTILKLQDNLPEMKRMIKEFKAQC